MHLLSCDPIGYNDSRKISLFFAFDNAFWKYVSYPGLAKTMEKRVMMMRLLALLAIACFVGMPSAALSSEWVLYGKPNDALLVAYYDRTHVVPIGGRMLRVTVKYVYSEAGRKEVVRSRKRSELPTEGYERLGHSIVQYELDCGRSRQAIFSASEIDLDGKELDRYNPPGRDWTPVKPGGIGEALLKKVCK